MQTVTKDFPNGEVVEFNNNFIMHAKGFFDDNLCDNMIDYFHIAKKYGQTLIREEYDTNDKTEKSDTATTNYTPGMPPTEEAKFAVLNEGFVKIVEDNLIPMYADHYFQELKGNVKIWDAPKIQKTEPGEGYHIWHCETFTRLARDRVLAYMLYLNDVDEGGETEFLYQHTRYKPIKGDLLIWPGHFTHVHRGNPPISGHKYITTGWIEWL